MIFGIIMTVVAWKAICGAKHKNKIIKYQQLQIEIISLSVILYQNFIIKKK